MNYKYVTKLNKVNKQTNILFFSTSVVKCSATFFQSEFIFGHKENVVMETPIPILSFWHIYLICGSLAEKAYSLAREFSRDQNIKQKSDFVKKIYIFDISY